MIRFYYIDTEYIKYLQQMEPRVPNIQYSEHDKFVCGIVLKIHDMEYYAPISHFKKKLRTNILITDKGNPIASIRFSFMFPVPQAVLTEMDFSEIAKTDRSYADLLSKEYLFCNTHEDKIHKKALEVYKIGTNRNHPLNRCCCDFKKLEKIFLHWQLEKQNEEATV